MNENYQQAPAVQPQNGIFPVTNFFTGQTTGWIQNLSSRLAISKMNWAHVLRRLFKNNRL
jgi:hypothetical protein